MPRLGKGIGIDLVHLGSVLNPAEYYAYLARVAGDSGTVKNTTNTATILRGLKTIYGALADHKLIWTGDMGVKLRTVAPYNYITKGYSTDTTPNDLTQTTELNQPFMVGGLSTSNKYGIKNINTGVRFLNNPSIAFTSSQPWTITVCLNWNMTNTENSNIFGSTNTAFRLYAGAFVFGFRNETGTSDPVSANGLTKPLIGKTSILTYVADGLGHVDIYINGAFVTRLNATTNINLIYLGFSRSSYLASNIYSYFIKSGIATVGQISQEYNMLRGFYPEVESVQIGALTVAVNNVDIVANLGTTRIPDGNAVGAWTPGTLAHCYHSSALGITGKLYNKAARNAIIASPPAGWHVSTEAELTAIAALGGNALKVAGTDFWNTTGGTNTSGFCAVGGASRNADGSFNTWKDTVSYWCADSDKVLKLYHNSDVAEIVAATANQGHYIRLVKN